MIGGFVLWNSWWAWIIFGLILGVLEMLLPAYVFVSFSAGAILTGLGLWVGVFGGSLAWTLVTFAVLSGVSVLVLRLTLGAPTRKARIWTTDIND
jgi:membrane protein implicated in regulation of membrane protease activity